MSNNKGENYLDKISNSMAFGSIDVITLLGVCNVIILSKDIYKKNAEVSRFIEKTMGVTLPPYVIKSRTLIAARISRVIMAYNSTELNSVGKKINKELQEVIDGLEFNSGRPQKRNKRRNQNEKLEKWLKGL